MSLVSALKRADLGRLDSPLLRLAAAAAAGAAVGYLLGLASFYKHRSADEADERRVRAMRNRPAREIPAGVELTEGWRLNSRGMLLAYKQYIPKGRPVIGCIGMCHGYGDHTQDMHMDIPLRLCTDGFAVFSMEIEGHGLSDGLHAHLPDLKTAVADLAEYFLEQMDSRQLRHKSLFLYGHSMGGAVAFNLCTLPQYRELQSLVKGVVLCAPMVKIADELRPGALVIGLLRLLSRLVPLAPVTPVKDIQQDVFRQPQARARSEVIQLAYQKKPRVATALEMLDTTEDISGRMGELRHPLLILHGGADVVTCPKLSQVLFDRCLSKDKSIKIYDGCWHDILNGESEEQVGFIYNDLCSWMKARC